MKSFRFSSFGHDKLARQFFCFDIVLFMKNEKEEKENIPETFPPSQKKSKTFLSNYLLGNEDSSTWNLRLFFMMSREEVKREEKTRTK
jgi:hypothetical protein